MEWEGTELVTGVASLAAGAILNRSVQWRMFMFGPDLFATLALAASIMAPALRAADRLGGRDRVHQEAGHQWQASCVPDGNYKPAGRLRSIQYIVVKDEKGRIQVIQDGKPVWVDKEDMVRLKDAVEHYTKMLDGESEATDTWFALPRLGPAPNGQTAEALQGLRRGHPAEPDGRLVVRQPRAHPHGGEERRRRHRGLLTCIDQILDERSAAAGRCRVPEPGDGVLAEEGVWRRPPTDYATRGGDSTRSRRSGRTAWRGCYVPRPDAKVRDGKRAVEAATKACELTNYKNGGYLDTLAAAYAEVGDFDKAVEWQEKALKAGDIPVKDLDAARKRLELFKQKKAYREVE